MGLPVLETPFHFVAWIFTHSAKYNSGVTKYVCTYLRIILDLSFMGDKTGCVEQFIFTWEALNDEEQTAVW